MTGARRRRPVGQVRATATALLAVAALAVTACEPVRTPVDDTATPSSSSSCGPTERPTELATDIRECQPDGGGAGDGAVLTDGALAGWDVSEPDGFIEVGGGSYGQFAPIEGDYTARYFNLDPEGFPDVLGAAYYAQLERGPVTDACGRLDESRVLDRIAQQLAEAPEVAQGEPTTVKVGGVVGYEVLAQHESGYMIRNYFFYGVDELLHIECQWVEHETEIDQGCVELLDSLTW